MTGVLGLLQITAGAGANRGTAGSLQVRSRCEGGIGPRRSREGCWRRRLKRAGWLAGRNKPVSHLPVRGARQSSFITALRTSEQVQQRQKKRPELVRCGHELTTSWIAEAEPVWMVTP